jgi:hypothetical protein
MTSPTSLTDRLMRLWSETLPADDSTAEAAFRELYTDPVTVNGITLSVADLVARARSLQGTFEGLHAEVVDRVETRDHVVVGFYLRGRHTGQLATPLGTVAPTGREVEIRTTDILTIRDGLVSAVWVVSDELGLLTQLGVVTLTAS